MEALERVNLKEVLVDSVHILFGLFFCSSAGGSSSKETLRCCLLFTRCVHVHILHATLFILDGLLRRISQNQSPLTHIHAAKVEAEAFLLLVLPSGFFQEPCPPQRFLQEPCPPQRFLQELEVLVSPGVSARSMGCGSGKGILRSKSSFCLCRRSACLIRFFSKGEFALRRSSARPLTCQGLGPIAVPAFKISK